MSMKAVVVPFEAGAFFEFGFTCPGCGCMHGIRTKYWPEPDNLVAEDKERFKAKWEFDGDIQKPTVTPSLLYRSIDDRGIVTVMCHSIITKGMITFLPDSAHELAGKTVEIPVWDGEGDVKGSDQA